MPPVTRRNTQFTLRSTHRVSQLLTGRGTISVPMTLAHAVSTSAAPKAAATQRAASGTTMGSPRTVGGYAEPTEARAGAGPRGRLPAVGPGAGAAAGRRTHGCPRPVMWRRRPPLNAGGPALNRR